MRTSIREKEVNFIRKSLVGGLVVLLPLAIVGFFFRWIYNIVTDVISPLTNLFVKGFGLPGFAADLIGLAALVGLCFLVGNMVATRMGAWIWQHAEDSVIARLPGYRSVRDVIIQLLGDRDDSPLSRGEVARIWLYGRQVDVSVLGLVTSRHEDGRVSVFVPTGPNPTSGFIYHVSMEVVTLCPEIGVEQMLKAVIGCGAGTGALFAGLPQGSLEPGGRTNLRPAPDEVSSTGTEQPRSRGRE